MARQGKSTSAWSISAHYLSLVALIRAESIFFLLVAKVGRSKIDSLRSWALCGGSKVALHCVWDAMTKILRASFT
jgi:hypothetical protein